MELRQLEYFNRVCEFKSFTRAAEEMYVSQPSITNAIHKLERELGVQLLQRDTKRVILTAKGELFHNRVTDLLSKLQAAITEMAEMERQIVKMGLPPMIGALFFPDIFVEFNQLNPLIELQVSEKGSESIRGLLEQGELELGFMILPQHSDILEMIPLIHEQLVICLPQDHPLAGERNLSLEQLAKEKFILLSPNFVHHELAISECRRQGFTPNVVFTSDQVETVKAMVSHGSGITLMMERFVKEDDSLVKVPLSRPIDIPIGLAWKRKKTLSKECLQTIQFIQDSFTSGRSNKAVS